MIKPVQIIMAAIKIADRILLKMLILFSFSNEILRGADCYCQYDIAWQSSFDRMAK